MTRKKVALGAAFAIAVVLTIAGVLAAIISTRTIPSSGTIRGVNLSIYWDAGFANATSLCEWGTLDNGTSVNRTIYIRNTGTDSMTLNMTASSWNPSNATNALTLVWDKEGATVNANDSVVANLTLSVDSSFTTGMSFSVDIKITGTH